MGTYYPAIPADMHALLGGGGVLLEIAACWVYSCKVAACCCGLRAVLQFCSMWMQSCKSASCGCRWRPVLQLAACWVQWQVRILLLSLACCPASGSMLDAMLQAVSMHAGGSVLSCDLAACVTACRVLSCKLVCCAGCCQVVVLQLAAMQGVFLRMLLEAPRPSRSALMFLPYHLAQMMSLMMPAGCCFACFLSLIRCEFYGTHGVVRC